MKRRIKNKMILTGLYLFHDRMIVDFDKFPKQRDKISEASIHLAELTRKYEHKCRKCKKWYGKNS